MGEYKLCPNTVWQLWESSPPHLGAALSSKMLSVYSVMPARAAHILVT